MTDAQRPTPAEKSRWVEQQERVARSKALVLAQVLAAGGTVDGNGKFNCHSCGLIRRCSTRATVICELSDSVAGVDNTTTPNDGWLKHTHEPLRPEQAWWNTGDEDGEQMGLGSQVQRWKKRTGRVA